MRGNRRQRQQANKELINSTVKVGIDKIFSDLALQAVIIKAVKLATPIELQGQMLAQYHVLRLLQLGQCPGPWTSQATSPRPYQRRKSLTSTQ